MFFLAFASLLLSIKKSKFFFGEISRHSVKTLVYANADEVNATEVFARSIDNVALIIQSSRLISGNRLIELRQRCVDMKINLYEYKNFFWNFKFIYSCLKIIFKAVFCISKIKLNQIELSILLRTLKYQFDDKLLLSNIRFKQLISDDDYSPAHVIRTRLFNLNNIKHAGIQHSSGNGIGGGGSIAFIYYDFYLIWNQFTLFNFKKYWGNLDFPLIEVGYRRIDEILKSFKNHDEISRVKNSINNDFFQKSTKCINVLVTLPRFKDQSQFISDFKNLNYSLNGMKIAIEMYSHKINFIFRSKGIMVQPIEAEKRFFESKNIVIHDTRKYKTTDLIIWSDYVIASNGSGVITEACLLNRQVLTFDFIDGIHNIWSFFGKDMCLRSKEELLNVIKNIANKKSLAINRANLEKMIISEKNKLPLSQLIPKS